MVVPILSLVALIGFQAGMRQALDAAKAVLPEAKWSAPRPLESGQLIQGTSTYRVYEGFIAGGQGASTTGYTGPPPPDPRPFKTYPSVEQLLLVPIAGSQPKKISWPTVANEFAILETDLGEGYGYHWYGRGSLLFLDDIRKQAKLDGGEDLRAFYVRALGLQDGGTMTCNTAFYLLEKYGDDAVPFIRDELNRENALSMSPCVRLLGAIRTPLAEAELGQLYSRRDDKVRNEVRWAVVRKPYIASLKSIYADALTTQDRLVEAARAAAEFGWSNFLPALREQYPRAKDVVSARALYEAIDQLSAHRLDREIVASHGLAETKDGKDLALLLSSPEHEYIALLGLDFATRQTKSRNDQIALGLKLLDSVPKDVASRLIERFGLAKAIESARNVR